MCIIVLTHPHQFSALLCGPQTHSLVTVKTSIYISTAHMTFYRIEIEIICTSGSYSWIAIHWSRSARPIGTIGSDTRECSIIITSQSRKEEIIINAARSPCRDIVIKNITRYIFSRIIIAIRRIIRTEAVNLILFLKPHSTYVYVSHDCPKLFIIQWGLPPVIYQESSFTFGQFIQLRSAPPAENAFSLYQRESVTLRG